MSKEQPLSGLETHLGYLLRSVSNLVSGTFARALHKQRASVAEWVMLRHLWDRQGITPGDLAEALGMTRGAVSKVLDKLERKKWIKRTTKAQDHRVQLLSLTGRGRNILPKLAAIADQNDSQFFDCLNADERSKLQTLLRKLAELHRISDAPIE